ncbi:MAG: hypothetical protein NTV04_23750, partial [Deltaproteobacteria bacterium]|nr:hypothetical protein [Deltaproteobacteria bacterium]
RQGGGNLLLISKSLPSPPRGEGRVRGRDQRKRVNKIYRFWTFVVQRYKSYENKYLTNALICPSYFSS